MTKSKHYESAYEFYRDCKDGKVSSRWNPTSTDPHCYEGGHARHSRSIGGYYTESWSGTNDFPTAYKLATEGWPQGTARAAKLADKLSVELIESLARPVVAFDVTGEQFDMGRVIAEEPECWMKWENGTELGQDEVKSGPVKIVVNCSVSSGIDTKVIETRGSAIMALVLVLESAGRPIRIEVTDAVQDSYEHLECSVTIKDYYDPIQVDACAFALIHPAFLRRMMFSMHEIMDIKNQEGYGHPTDTNRDRGDIYIGQAMYGDSAWQNEASAEKWVRNQLEMQGVRFLK